MVKVGKFLFQRTKNMNVILQKFVYPKEDKNCKNIINLGIIRAEWTPQVSMFTKKTNLKKLNGKNKYLDILEKVTTFDGKEQNVVSESLTSPLISTDIEKICVNIVKHIQTISAGNTQVSGLTLFFKIDKLNRIWLLFCSQIKIRNKVRILY